MKNSKIDAHSADPPWKKASKTVKNSKIDAFQRHHLGKKHPNRGFYEFWMHLQLH
jgi:hypothetical protein